MTIELKQYGSREDLMDRINKGHTLYAYVTMNNWVPGSGFSCPSELDISDYESVAIVKGIAEGNLTPQSFNEGLDDPCGSYVYVEITIRDEDDLDDCGDHKNVWCDGTWGVKEKEED